MPSESYALSPLAKSDLEGIWSYTNERWSRAQADTYIDAIFVNFDRIVSGDATVKDVGDVRTGYYRAMVGSHFIFFKTNCDDIEIMRILHQSMNVDAHLN